MSVVLQAERRLAGGYRESVARNLLDRALAAAGLIATAPIGLLAAAAIVIDDPGPVFFRQKRVGRDGQPFELWKFRSMRRNNGGAQITAASDSRITRVGRLLRKFKLDELPQLWNVVRGDMSLIGPRPEVPRYVDERDPVWTRVLSVRPGITDLATLVFRNEEEILAKAEDPERLYRERVLPDKLALNLEYIGKRNLFVDCKLLWWTVRYSFAPGGFESSKIRDKVLAG
ncbi:MAG: sugar transferase [Bryobacteraceae bacterium]